MHRPELRRPRQLAAGLWSGLACVLMFAGTFSGSCWLAARGLPFPDVPEVTEKRAHLRAHGDDYDALFLGSSRVELQIIPAIFDRRLAELGFPLRSFNAGVSAMCPPEDAFFFDEIARGPRRRLRWVFIEVDVLRLRAERARAESGRVVYWHDAPRMRLMWRCFLAEWQRSEKKLAGKKGRKRPWFERLEGRLRLLGGLRENVSAFLENRVNLGRVAVLANRVAQAGPELRATPDLSAAHAGWVRHAGPMKDADRADYEQTYADRLTTPQAPAPANFAGDEALRQLVKKVTAIGATPVLLISPTTRRTQFQPPDDLRRSCLLLDFSDVRAFPDLFRPEHRLDVEHLNEWGAPIYSRLLAEQFFAAVHSPAPR